MKKPFLLRIALLLCAAILLGCLPTGCTQPEPEPEPTPTVTLIGEGAPTYTIIRRELDPERTMIDLAVGLTNALKEATGTKLPLSTDYVNRGETAPTDTLEILVGPTNRQESLDAMATLGENEYVVKLVNNRLVILGQSDNATAAAMQAFLKDVLGYDQAAGTYAVTELVIPVDLCITGAYVPGVTDIGKEPEPEPEAPRVPITSPLLRDESATYSYFEARYACTNAGEDAKFLLENRGNQLEYCRFADGNGHITYVFDIHDKYEPLITYTIGNDYKIEISPDNKSWETVIDWTAEHDSCHDRSNQSAVSINPYDFGVYDTCYIKFTDATPTDGWGACFTDLTFAYYEVLDLESLNIFNLEDDMYDILSNLDYTTEDPSAVAAYKLDADGGLVYNPISREKAAELSKYDGADTTTGTIKTTVGGVEYTVSYKIPKKVTAYDAVPIWYEVTTNKANSKPVYIEATAFEDASRTDSDKYFALTLPDKVDVTWEYLGYVGGDDKTTNRPKNTAKAETSKPGKQYPQYNASELLYTGDCKRSSIMWWKFRYTNTGNTILDGDGNGTFCVEAHLYVKNGNEWTRRAGMENIYNRIIDTVYPGESGEMYFIFDNCYDLPAGDYKIVINSIVRNETSNPENYGRTIWGGEVYSQSEFTFKISAKGSDTKPAAVVKTSLRTNPARNSWLHRYEEFMTSYDSLLKGVKNNKVADTMYIQCAPWTEQITLRLIVGTDHTLSAVTIPLQVESDSLKINFNPNNNNYVVLDDGTRFPVISAQSMADMRGNVQLGPDAAYNVIDNLMDMRDIGINVINTTAAFEFDGSYGNNRANNIDACWFSLDVARVLGLKTEGWITYPYEGTGSLGQANSLFGKDLKQTGYGSPDLALANALNTIWQYLRWGDNYWVGGDDTVVLDVEDTRGWMRVDFNARFTMTETSKSNFRLFLMDKYGTIEELNDDWGTEYTSFAQIDPEAGTTDDHGWRSYKNKNAAFKEWGRAVEVLDMFRTLERIEDYEMVLSEVHKTVPTARINVRTEGANWIAPVDPTTDNSHLRHVYYSQRRCAIIPELMGASGVLYASSDYTTLPYTPSEVAELTAASIENGIVPILLPQFNRMRDIAINTTYGTDFTYEYNLRGNATKGAYINTVCSVYEWFVATYENGGVPGILWQDYLCDGYATETQRREIAFFTEKLTEALNTSEGRAWAKQSGYDASVLSGSEGLWSYDRQMVQDLIDRVADER